jgi:ribosomal protein S27E
MGILDALKPTGQATENDDLRNRLADLEAINQIRSSHNQFLTDEQVANIRADRAREDERLRANEEAEASVARRDGENAARVRKLVTEMISDGRMILWVNGSRIKSMGNDLTVKCAHCGSPLHHISTGLFELAISYDATPVDQRFGPDSRVIVRNARDPLGSFIGVAGFIDGGHCPQCNHLFTVFAQLVLG